MMLDTEQTIFHSKKKKSRYWPSGCKKIFYCLNVLVKKKSFLSPSLKMPF